MFSDLDSAEKVPLGISQDRSQRGLVVALPNEATNDCNWDPAGVALDKFAGCCELIGCADLLHPELVTVGIFLADIAKQWIQAGDTNCDVGLTLSPRSTECVGHDDGDVKPEFGEPCSLGTTRCIRVNRQRQDPVARAAG